MESQLPRQEPTYCTLDDVAETLDYPDERDPTGLFKFTETSHPSAKQVKKMILANEDIIDRRTRKSWRENYVKNYVCDIGTYQWDANAWRAGYYLHGGNFIQLHSDVLPWDVTKGDRLYLRNRNNTWIDISEAPNRSFTTRALDEEHEYKALDADAMQSFWFDYSQGKLYLRNRILQQNFNAVRISYRYGSTEPVPAGVNRLCCLLTASQIVNMQAFNVKIGIGGDIGNVKQQLLDTWAKEIGELYGIYQCTGAVYSLYR